MSRISRPKNASEVVQAIGSIFQPLLASPDTLKCVRDEDQFILSNCGAFILQNLDIQHPLGHLLNSAVQAHHETFGCGIKTLITLTAFWTQSLEDVIQQGVSPHQAIEFFQSALDECISHLMCSDFIINISSIIEEGKLPKDNPQNAVTQSEDDPDDVSWFFNDVEDPEFPIERMSTVNDLSVEAADCMSRVVPSGVIRNDHPKEDVRTHDFEDDFEDCFDHVKCQSSRDEAALLKSKKSLSLKSCSQSDEFQAKLDALLLSKSAKRQNIALNQSRHCADVNGIVEEFKSGQFLSCGHMFPNHQASHIEPISVVDKKLHSVEQLAMCASHGEDRLMKFVLEAFGHHETTRQFDLSSILTYCVSAPVHQTSLHSGIILNNNQNVSKCCNALVINGDVTPTYKHVGYKQNLKFNISARYDSHGAADLPWPDQVLNHLKAMNINALFIRGTVDDDLRTRCESEGVLLCMHVPYKSLKVMSEGFDVDLVNYILDSDQGDILKDVQLEPLSDFNRSLISVVMDDVRTLIVCHPSEAVAHHHEERFWHCAKRFSHIISAKRACKGQGVLEQEAAAFLNKRADELERSDALTEGLQSLVYRCVSRGFVQFCLVVNTNTASCDTVHGMVLDDPTKVNIWQNACHVISQMLLCANEIIVGVENQNDL
ncbi:hypothetical protein CAPTEDRAFT_205266 [Capitella teleta]|uniref:Bardet-Biedl syndrome 12 protein n=1 Tax=Capitella teleta TaxID=283909 RepID=R7VDV0_CAPTE|nr:hypothetical protein CAPTEDRAFT_205266 [Capitella teleta]|eukprot:ELU16799.1 hypothetical protein CAPTEDRAFT_205266 [Capitella teleta]